MTSPSNTSTSTRLLSVLLAEDAWQGDANAIVRVDGVIVYQGAVTAKAGGAGARIDLGSFDASVGHVVTVQFTNDAYGGTAATDRNLYVKDVLVDGASTGQSGVLMSNGTASFRVAGTAPPSAISLGQGADTVSFSISEDAWQGDAQFVVLVDGKQVGGVQTAAALHKSGQEQDVQLHGDFTTAGHQVSVRFLNDAWGGTATTDRNLYVDAVKLNGVDLGKSQALMAAGDATFAIKAAPASTAAPAAVTVGDGAQVIHIRASEDAWQGDAHMVVSVDGKQVGTDMTVTASHAAGQVQDFFIKGNFGAGTHHVTVAFTNDAYGGTATTDRNLYVTGVALDGTEDLASPQILASNGNISVDGAFSTSPVASAPPPSTSTSPVSSSPTTSSPTTSSSPTSSSGTAPQAGASSDVGLVPVGAPVYAAGANVLTVGVDKQYKTIAAAIAASHDNDVILVDSGTYTNDFAVVNTKISLIAVGGRVTMNATVPPPNYKGILTEETDLKVVGFTFTNARIPDEFGHNGAGIRVDGGHLTLINDEFVGNQDGILTNAGSGITVTIDHSVFNDNGGADGNGAGNIHNVYIGDVASATVTNSIFENAQVGHEFKSRAEVNTLTNNVFISGVGIGTGSYDIDIPNGGKTTIANNTIIKGPNAQNANMVHFGGEGIPYAGSSLTLTGNLFQNTNASAVGLLNQTSVTAQISGNVLDGLSSSAFVQGPAHLSNNYDASGIKLQDQTLSGVLPGSTLVITDADPHNVTLAGGQIQAVQGGDGRLTVNVQGGRIIVIGGKGGIDVTENATTGGNQYTTVAGSTNSLKLYGVGGNSIDSEGTDLIIAGDGNESAQLNGNATVVGGKGNSNWSVNGTASIDTGAGSAFMTLGAIAKLTITGTNDFFKLDSNGGTASWNTTNAGSHVAGSSDHLAMSMQVYSGQMNITTAGGQGGILKLDAGNAVVTSVGAETITAGSGNDMIIVSGGATVYAGTGALSVFAKGGGNGANVYAAAGDVVIDGDSGGITYHGGAQANTVEARLSNITLLGGDGLLTINGGSRDTVVGGRGGLVYHDYGYGANTITTLAGSTNLLEISGSNQVNSYGRDTIHHDGGNTSIVIHGDSTLTLADGNSSIDLYGHDIVQVAAGYNHFNVFQGADTTFTLASLNVIHEISGTVRVTFNDSAAPAAGPAAVTVSGGVADISTTPGSGVGIATDGTSGPVNIVATTGAVSVGTAGADSVHLGAGTASVAVHGSGAEIWAGSGALTLRNDNAKGGSFTVHGGSGSESFDLGSSRMKFIGGSGAATLTGGIMDIVAGSGDINVVGNYGSHVASFVGGSGNATLALDGSGADITFGTGHTAIRELGYGAANIFRFLAGQNGTDVISNFVAGTDKAVLGAGVKVTSSNVVGGSAHFVLSNGADVTFAGIGKTAGIFG